MEKCPMRQKRPYSTILICRLPSEHARCDKTPLALGLKAPEINESIAHLTGWARQLRLSEALCPMHPGSGEGGVSWRTAASTTSMFVFLFVCHSVIGIFVLVITPVILSVAECV